MDILEEIEALVTERSLGEIKLNKDAVKDVAFGAGAGIAKSPASLLMRLRSITLDDIAVDLARASPVRELSAVDKPAGPGLHLKYVCSNCGWCGGAS